MARFTLPPTTRTTLLLLLTLSLATITSHQFHANAPHALHAYLIHRPPSSLLLPWTLFTTVLCEPNLLTLLIASTTILFAGRYLERAWSSYELARYIVITGLVPTGIAAGVYGAFFLMTGAGGGSLHAPIQGSISIQAAFLVAFKQLVPEHTVSLARGLVRIRVKHFPAIFLAANTFSGVFLGTPTASLLAWLGFLAGWTYLRFYKVVSIDEEDGGGGRVSGGLKGDKSETFAFAYFWPDVVHGPVSRFSDGVFNVLVAVGLCLPFSEEEVQVGNAQAGARGSGGVEGGLLGGNGGGRRGGGGGSRAEEAERRRALALKALDERLKAAGAMRDGAGNGGPSTTTGATDGEAVEGRERQSEMV